MYDVGEEDCDAFIDQSQNSLPRQSYPIHMQLPVVEVMKVLISYSLIILTTFVALLNFPLLLGLNPLCHSTFIVRVIRITFIVVLALYE